MQPQDYVDLRQLEDNFWWFAGMREIAAALLDPIFSSDRKDRRRLPGFELNQNCFDILISQ